ncbi:hypothetical protein LTR94_025626 [Friedmanniomyces endolithicus]|nr:hypothetical protein LTR94_025626 [Friedmanniomyces endolithicus]
MPSISRHLADYFDASTIALSLAHHNGDCPLALVNASFERLTGYPREDVIDQNCRFLQRDAANEEARSKIRDFLNQDQIANIRTPLVNFRRDGTPFINLLYMSKLRDRRSRSLFILGSQFDVSRTDPDKLTVYDAALAQALKGSQRLLDDTGYILDGTLTALANGAATIAQAKLLLADLETAQGSNT